MPYPINRQKLAEDLHSVELNEGQTTAIEGLLDWYNDWHYQRLEKRQGAILKGFPGCGKSFLVAQLIKAIIASQNLSSTSEFRVILAAPTNQAKEVLRDFSQNNGLWRYCQVTCTTVHSLAGMRMEGLTHEGYMQDLWNQDDERQKASLVVVDEYPMMDQKVYKELELMPYKVPTLFVGDTCQLKAVSNGRTIPIYDLDPSVPHVVDHKFKDHAFVLNEVVRFAGSILRYTHLVRECYSDPRKDSLKLPTAYPDLTDDKLRVITKDEFLESVVPQIANDERFWTEINDSKVLAYTNNAVTSWNKTLRRSRYGEVEGMVDNEILIVKDPVYGLVDGEIKRLFYTNQKFIPEGVESVTLEPKLSEDIGELKFQKVYALNAYQQMTEFLCPLSESYSILSKYFVKRFEDIKAIKKPSNMTDEEHRKQMKLFWNEWNQELRIYGLSYKNDPDLKNPIKRQVIPYYSATIHSMQGSTIREAYIDWSDIMKARLLDDKKRLIYVAASRATERVTIIIP